MDYSKEKPQKRWTKDIFTSRFAQYEARLMDETFIRLPFKERAKVFGVGYLTVNKWDQLIDWKKIAEKYRKMYAKHYPEIDMALIHKAKKGDTKAIELFYERFENWSSKSGVSVNITADLSAKSNKELIEEMMKGMTKEEREKFMGGGELVLEAEVVGGEGGEEDGPDSVDEGVSEEEGGGEVSILRAEREAGGGDQEDR